MLALALALALAVCVGAMPLASASNQDSVQYFDLTNHSRQEKKVCMPNGEQGMMVLTYKPIQERFIGDYALSDGEWEIYFYGASMNVRYYIDIKNSRITNARDLWYLGIGWAINDSSLSCTSTKSTGRLDASMFANGFPISTVFYLTAQIEGNRLYTGWEA